MKARRPSKTGTSRQRIGSPYRKLRLHQLERSLSRFNDAKAETRPHRGWLRAVREALGLSAAQVAQPLGVTRGRILEFENAEAEDRITLRSLRRVAEAMGCELVYAIVPKTGTLEEMAERRARAEATQRVSSVENSMALENQAVGHTDELIEEETKRILKRT